MEDDWIFQCVTNCKETLKAVTEVQLSTARTYSQLWELIPNKPESSIAKKSINLLILTNTCVIIPALKDFATS